MVEKHVQIISYNATKTDWHSDGKKKLSSFRIHV